MEVKQSDGLLQPATISKLIDQSTYTVGESYYGPQSWHMAGLDTMGTYHRENI